MQTYSLFELNNYIRQVVALNFEEAVWITCEISQIRESRGQVYLELIQQNEEETEIIARNAATIWYKTRLFIKKKLGELYSAIIQDGTQVSVKVKVEFHERYGLKLNILDIDPSYTIGQLEMQRKKIIERLRSAGVFDLNRKIDLPRVLQRIAIISSENAAGYKDFIHQLEHNAYGYAFQRTLYQTAVQGVKVEREVSEALDHIKSQFQKYDCVIIIRGGGSKLDLAAFDNYNIAYKIATCPVPVLTGIGHEIDSSVSDMLAHTPLKTPTAVADYLIEHTMLFEGQLDQLGLWVQQYTKQHTQGMYYTLESIQSDIKYNVFNTLNRREEQVIRIGELLKQSSSQLLQSISIKLEHMKELVKLSAPESVLKRGYAIVRQGGKVVQKGKNVISGELLEVEFQDEKIQVLMDDEKKR